MKLPIKKEFFNEILAGKKTLEFRDAHLILICEDTGRALQAPVVEAEVWTKDRALMILGHDLDRLFDDSHTLMFHIGHPELLPRLDAHKACIENEMLKIVLKAYERGINLKLEYKITYVGDSPVAEASGKIEQIELQKEVGI